MEKVKKIFPKNREDFDAKEFYTPLSVAKKEIQKRWKDRNLRNRVEDYLGGSIPDPFCKQPRAVLSRSIITPNMELLYFLDLVRDSKLKPIGLEGANDKFCTKNPDKVSLGKLSFFKKGIKNKINQPDGGRFTLNVIDMMSSDGKFFSNIKTFWGENLVDFHHRMLKDYELKIETFDDFEWFLSKKRKSNPKQYYENFLALFLSHGILFENFHGKGKEEDFTCSVIVDNFNKIKKTFGFKPLIVPLVPIEDERYLNYWNSYLIK